MLDFKDYIIKVRMIAMIKQHVSMLADFYEFTMAYAYYNQNRQNDIVYFDLFTRKHPDDNGYIIFNGITRIIEAVKNFKFTEDELEYLRCQGFDDDGFLDYLRHIDLKLDIYGVPDGTVMFKNEPLLTIRGPIIECQLVETLFLLSVNYSTLITTKASRIVKAAQGRAILEFGARRAQGYDAAVEGARCAVIGGCVGTSNTLAGYQYGVPMVGTLAHSYVQLFEDEYDAFLSYAKVHPDNTILLVDTYNTLKSGVPNAIRVSKEFLEPNGYRLKGIRLDSGDLAYLSKETRKMLDEAGLHDVDISASNSLNEIVIDDLIQQGAKIDTFGVGENLITSATSPVIGGVYKIVADEKDDGSIRPLIKNSDNVEKVTNPGLKRTYRFYDNETNKALADYIALCYEVVPEDEITIFDPLAPWKKKTLTNYSIRELHVPIFKQGELVYDVPSLQETIEYTQKELSTMWEEVLRLRNPHEYYVDLSQDLYDLKHDLIDTNIKKLKKRK